MLTNPDELVVRAATIIKSKSISSLIQIEAVSSLLDNIFYMQEYREQIYQLLRDYDNTKMTRWDKIESELIDVVL